ncbi:MAG: hypothetical protein ACOX30_08380 [Dethiobacteria bacterium]
MALWWRGASKKQAKDGCFVRGGGFTIDPVEDIAPHVGRAVKGGALRGAELAAISSLLKGVQRWQRFFKSEESIALYPLIAKAVSSLDGCCSLARELIRSIDPGGEVLDGASPALAALRRREGALQERIREKLDSYLRDSAKRRLLQETLVTIRGGRYVLPVKAGVSPADQGGCP